jgi:glycolate oxidase iron-sulfur subunit
MRAVMEGRIAADDQAFVTHIDRCLGCRACEPVCPSGVEYGYLLERARATIADAGRSSTATRVLLSIFGDRLFTRIAMTLGRILRATGLPTLLARNMPAGSARLGLAMLAATRRVDIASFERPAMLTTSEPAAPTITRTGPPAHVTRVAILEGCVQEGLFARVNRATARVLEANGCIIVHVPVQHCCGALHAHGGALEAAKQLARANLAAFDRSGADVIIANAAGCGAMLKDYGELLSLDPAWANRAAVFSSRVRDIFQFLAEHGVRSGAPVQVRVTYDAPCHLHHAQRVMRAPLDLLAAIPGLQHIPLRDAEECCGGAGIYGMLHPELGGRILDDKVAAIKETGADVVATANPGCAMQIGAGLILAGLDMPVVHPIELLDESYRRAGFVA